MPEGRLERTRKKYVCPDCKGNQYVYKKIEVEHFLVHRHVKCDTCKGSGQVFNRREDDTPRASQEVR